MIETFSKVNVSVSGHKFKTNKDGTIDKKYYLSITCDRCRRPIDEIHGKLATDKQVEAVKNFFSSEDGDIFAHLHEVEAQ